MIKLMGLNTDYVVTATTFPDKTCQVWKIPDIESFVKDSTSYIYWNFESLNEVVYIHQLCMLLKSHGAKIRIFCPMLPFGRQDKAIDNELTFGLYSFVKILESCHVTELITIDGHSDLAYEIFKANYISYISLKPTKEIEYAVGISKPDYVCLPDRGAFLRYREFFPNIPIIVMEKDRDQTTGKINGVFIDSINGLPVTKESVEGLNGKKILIVDDICDGGRTFIEVAKNIRIFAKVDVDLYVTHGIFSQGLNVLFDVFGKIFTKEGEVPST